MHNIIIQYSQVNFPTKFVQNIKISGSGVLPLPLCLEKLAECIIQILYVYITEASVLPCNQRI